jgi:hypothetical protein
MRPVRLFVKTRQLYRMDIDLLAGSSPAAPAIFISSETLCHPIQNRNFFVFVRALHG